MSKNNIYISCNAIVSNDNWSISYLFKWKIFAISLERLNRIKEFPDTYFANRLPSYQKELFNGITDKTRNYKKLISFRNYISKLINDTLKRKIDFDIIDKIYLMNFPFDITINWYEEKVVSEKKNFHHLFHACSAYFPSNFKKSAILCMDHDWCDEELWWVNPMHSIWYAKDNKLDFLYSDNFDTNKNQVWIGTVYHIHSKICSLNEGTFMWLSWYGNPKFNNVDIFDYSSGGPLISKQFFEQSKVYKWKLDSYDIEYDKELELEKDLINNFKKYYWIEKYDTDDLVNSKYADIADNVQKQTEKAIIFLANKAYELTKSKTLCIAGGVWLNILANTKILEQTPFEEIFVQPACSDEWLSLWWLYYYYHIINKNNKRIRLENPWLGFVYSNDYIKNCLENYCDKLDFKLLENKSEQVAELLNNNKVVWWFQWWSEFWPRALWYRSILANPKSKKIRDKVNNIKLRELFRPLAPVILEADIWTYMETDRKSPYMTLVAKVKNKYRKKLEWITHIDFTARYQTVSIKENTELYNLLKSYKNISWVWVLINTSFNVAKEPIVESPVDAIKMFLSTDLDYLIIWDFIVEKKTKYDNLKFNSKRVLKNYSTNLKETIRDLRIVNTCSNNCIYCLEQSYRIKDKFINKVNIFDKINNSNISNSINFYWWNPLLHPDLEEIIKFSKTKIDNIWILTNTKFLSKDKMEKLTASWLTSIWFYFNCFDKDKHLLLNGWWISLGELINNLDIIINSKIFYKAIIHINKQNIDRLYKDILLLSTRFWVKNIEFVNYFPFDRPYKNKEILEYDILKNRKNIDNLFKIIKKLWLKVEFIKFSKDFFWEYLDFYDFNNWIVWQIWEEDKQRLSWKDNPFCYTENRCKTCFIKDSCIFLQKKNVW